MCRFSQRRALRAIAIRMSRKAEGVLLAAAFPTRGRISPDLTWFPHHETSASLSVSSDTDQLSRGSSHLTA